MADDPRFPIGPFVSERRPLTDGERTRCTDTIEAHPARMRAAVAGLTDDQLDTPYRDGGWTVRQVVHHVVDSHLNSYIRFKLAVTEDHPRITTYEQDQWANFADGKTAPVEGSLRLLESLHARWVSFLRTLGSEEGARTVDHPELGSISVDTLFELYAWHCRHHEGHITELRRARGWG